MKALSLQAIADYCRGRLVAGDGATLALRVNTDSRTIQPGDLFFALSGERFNAHDFIPQVVQSGATAIVVSQLPENAADLGCGVILVGDPLTALQNLAREHRRLLKAIIIGITGSNGKTSTKDLTAAVMGRHYKVFCTVGNLNNQIGVPLTLLSMDETHQCGIIEMGMSHEGDINELTDIAEPDAAIITNIGVAHIEYMGSRESIAHEKGNLAEVIPSGGLVVLNATDHFTPLIAARSAARVVTAGVDAGDVSAHITSSTGVGTQFTLTFAGEQPAEVHLPIAGSHMVGNAALAAACGWHFGVPVSEIAAALTGAALTKGRLQIKHLRGALILDDSYNANPDSMKAGLQTLADIQVTGRRVAVLGRMGELGVLAESGHREVGEFAGQLKLDAVLSIGGQEASLLSTSALSVHPGLLTQHFETHAHAAAFLQKWLQEGDAVLLKGSRSSAMEQVLTHLQ